MHRTSRVTLGKVNGRSTHFAVQKKKTHQRSIDFEVCNITNSEQRTLPSVLKLTAVYVLEMEFCIVMSLLPLKSIQSFWFKGTLQNH